MQKGYVGRLLKPVGDFAIKNAGKLGISVPVVASAVLYFGGSCYKRDSRRYV
ncbi:MAG: hypothetical protein ABIA21_03060 [Candidatus Aenigmatarchaeota archaeon]